jgi:phosphopantothenoylcysteine synthetase/decarboxylase
LICTGQGRLAEPERIIVNRLVRHFANKTRSGKKQTNFNNRRPIVAIDPVRISKPPSKCSAIAEAFYSAGAAVTMVADR